MRKPILTLDFDGVIHIYSSGWKGASVIPDPPVPGALEFIVRALERFDVAVHSSRSHQWGGIRAMKRYLHDHYVSLGGCDPQGGTFEFDIPKWWSDFICEHASMEPWETSARDAARLVVKRIRWPLFKPASMISIDDRALTFDGTWPGLDTLAAFKPWNKRAMPSDPLLPREVSQ